MVRLPRNEKQTYWLNSRPQMWPMVWIYQIVTGVTSVVGVPSTHLVLNENVWIPIKNSLKFVPKGPINNIPTLVQIMAWCWPGDKPLSEPMMIILLTHICVTRLQWVKKNIVHVVGSFDMKITFLPPHSWYVIYINSLALGNWEAFEKKKQFPILFYWFVSLDFIMIMPSDEYHGTLLMIR